MPEWTYAIDSYSNLSYYYFLFGQISLKQAKLNCYITFLSLEEDWSSITHNINMNALCNNRKQKGEWFNLMPCPLRHS